MKLKHGSGVISAIQSGDGLHLFYGSQDPKGAISARQQTKHADGYISINPLKGRGVNWIHFAIQV